MSSTTELASQVDEHTRINMQLIWNRLLAIVEEQAQVLMRTAFSTVVREAGDLSAGVFDPDGRMIAQAVTGTPGHVNAMAAAVGKFLARYPLATLQPGDVLVTNDPWDGTGHLNDFTVVTPVFAKRDGTDKPQVFALFASTSHIADVGGRGFGPDANELFEEGLRIPIMPLFQQGERNQVLFDIIAANVRDPGVAEGDLYSLTACNDRGAEQLLAMISDFSLQEFELAAQEILERSEQAMRAAIGALPDGQWRADMTVDGYDIPIDIHCQLTISGSDLALDFSGTSATSPFGINVPLPYTEAYASFGVRCIVGNNLPNNAGSLAPVTVTAPHGCILNAQPPRAVSARHALGQMLPDVVLGALGQVIDSEVPAEGASCIWNPVFLSAASAGNEAESFVINPIFNGGTGARVGKDGLSTTAFPSGVRTTPTEVNEVTSPLVIWHKEYLTDSGGDGAWRGGLGQRIEIGHRNGAPFYISKMFDRIDHPARGRNGGADGRAGRVYLDDGTQLKAKGKDLVPAGKRLIMETPGGGGAGEPLSRQKPLREQDVLHELTSALTPRTPAQPGKTTPRAEAMDSQPGELTIQISCGELIDRLTILQIKSERLPAMDQRQHVASDRDNLQSEFDRTFANSDALPELKGLEKQLFAVNSILWDVEDQLRNLEALKQFDAEFVDLARSVYLHNDKRATLKRSIDRLVNSPLWEEKSYRQYAVHSSER